MKCSRCNIAKSDVRTVADPYVEEMTGERRMVPLCGDCYGDLCEEI
ncbi:hypothetical protein ACFYST_30645 [Kitasatospora sp. NPDC004614]